MDTGQSCTSRAYSGVSEDKQPCSSWVFDGATQAYSNWTPVSWVLNSARTIPSATVVGEIARIVGDPIAVRQTDVQVGGDHYSKRAIQPIDYIRANGLGFCEGNVVKYITRWRDKDGVKDLQKARHYIDFLIEDIRAGINKGLRDAR